MFGRKRKVNASTDTLGNIFKSKKLSHLDATSTCLRSSDETVQLDSKCKLDALPSDKENILPLASFTSVNDQRINYSMKTVSITNFCMKGHL